MTPRRCLQAAAVAFGAVWPYRLSWYRRGADDDEVYTFAFFHYAVAGVRVRF